METYFTKFSNTVYNDVSCTDITKRVSLSQKILRRKNLFYLYEIENNLKDTNYTFSKHTKMHVEMLEKLTND